MSVVASERAAWPRVVASALLVVCWVGVFVSTHIPRVPTVIPLTVADKWMHAIAYFVLASCAVQLFRNWASLLGAGLGLVLLGIGIEYAQDAFTADRMIDARDALANTLGVIAGLATRLTPWRDLLLRLDGRSNGL